MFDVKHFVEKWGIFCTLFHFEWSKDFIQWNSSYVKLDVASVTWVMFSYVRLMEPAQHNIVEITAFIDRRSLTSISRCHSTGAIHDEHMNEKYAQLYAGTLKSSFFFSVFCVSLTVQRSYVILAARDSTWAHEWQMTMQVFD